MNNELSTGNVDTSSRDVQGWDGAISDAETVLKQAEKRVKELKKAVRLMRQNRRDGLAWPKTGHK